MPGGGRERQIPGHPTAHIVIPVGHDTHPEGGNEALEHADDTPHRQTQILEHTGHAGGGIHDEHQVELLDHAAVELGLQRRAIDVVAVEELLQRGEFLAGEERFQAGQGVTLASGQGAAGADTQIAQPPPQLIPSADNKPINSGSQLVQGRFRVLAGFVIVNA